MTSKLVTPIETTKHALQHGFENHSADEYIHSLMSSRWGKHFENLRDHNLSQDTTPGEIDFTTLLVPPKVPDLIGRDLCTTIPVTTPTIQIPVFHIGKSSKTQRGEAGYLSSAGRMTYIDGKLSEALNTFDSVDQSFLEDLQMGMIQYYWQELTRVHRQDVSQAYVDHICNEETGNKTDPSGNRYSVGSGQVRSETAASMGEFTEAYNEARKDNWMPDTLVLTYGALSRLMSVNDFTNNDFFKEFANFNTGSLSSFYGLRIFVTSQKTGRKYWMFDSQNYACAVMRRDEMIVNVDDNANLAKGLAVSSRYGFAYRDFSRMIRGSFS